MGIAKDLDIAAAKEALNQAGISGQEDCKCCQPSIVYMARKARHKIKQLESEMQKDK